MTKNRWRDTHGGLHAKLLGAANDGWYDDISRAPTWHIVEYQ